ncbi:class I SAM-dependent methyltransferase [Jeotgalicoccus nanhaiensis]|jgi:Adenine-specific DNA methylase|uniref:Class I SAM-dependent methyltransferase n=1 Tax=Jeotgalicoccus nanhaiensis TaxID=568603 RepID=A0ABR9XYT0_9STAP|nr:class I SAM-dependent methyltransferase [Jeotgalicoccus nanhaiensis]MBF0754062.1 class I SAM-dependent methyltransferase [Jeotgalicoccus nanhaiensis]TFU61547.1 class I SAM-dependent methyltransferase [Jeotgalicoccus nanhaiensis]
MAKTTMEQVYEELNTRIDEIVKKDEKPRLEALAESLLQVNAEGSLSDLRKAFQFSYLNQVKEEPVQSNHQLTPDAIGYLVAHIIDLFTAGKETELLDIGSGTGHLAMTVKEMVDNVNLSGVEVDPALAEINANLCEFLKVPMYIHPQNVIEPSRIPSGDIAIGDLPVGYYPLPAANYKTAFEEGQSYAHLLMLEAGMNLVKDDGLGVFIVPSNMLEENNETIKKYISEDATLLMFLNLPATIFKTEKQRKSIIVLKKGFSPLVNNEVLIGDVPDFKNAAKMQEFLRQLNDWYEQYSGKQ